MAVKRVCWILSPGRDVTIFTKCSPPLACLENVSREKYGQLNKGGLPFLELQLN
jgi:hypothetical protein